MTQSRIMRLDEKTASKIAAGEVVERPAMVVKELVENAIDAGATEIIVEIKKGGKAFIKVTDNGSGIHSDDLNLVFERHATSKIRLIEDLYKSQTLGFRGEALSSICAVSNVELITMRKGEKIGKKVVAAGGTLHKISEVGTIQGTTLIVRDLFFNTPARLKFLKTDQVEGRSITELMGYLALSHPEIAFQYTTDEKLIFHTQGKGNLSNAIFSIFDPLMLKGLYAIDEVHEHIKIHGFISKFDYTKGSKSYQLTFINGRYVKSDLIREVIQFAYKPYLMNNRYPVCILFIEIPQNEIDVNIHPAKTEIKFHDDGLIKQFIYSALKKSFNRIDQVPKVVFSEREVFSLKTEPDPEVREKMLEMYENQADAGVAATLSANAPANISDAPANVSDAPANVSDAPSRISPDAGQIQAGQIPAAGQIQASQIPAAQIPASQTGAMVEKNKTLPLYPTKHLDRIDFGQVDFSSLTHFAEQTALHETPLKKDASIYQGLNYIGVYNKTYLLYEKETHLFLIDQHAAHEKILFETFMEAFENQEIQSQILLIPEVIELSIFEMSHFEEANPVLRKMGFGVEIFGDSSIVIREIPSLFTFTVAKGMVQALLDNVKSEIDDRLYYIVAEKACKAAVKAHDTLHDGEQSALVESLMKLKSPYTCPHGRPIIISFSLNEIERKFKRIL